MKNYQHSQRSFESKTVSNSNRNDSKKDYTPVLQPKLTIGKPNDKYEEEADSVADQVMRMSDPVEQVQRKCESCEEEESLQTKPVSESITPWIQTQPLEEEEEELQTKAIQTQPIEEEEEEIMPKIIQRQPVEEEEEPIQALIQKQEEEEEPVQTKSEASPIRGNNSWLQTKLNTNKGGGSPLPDNARSFMETRFGTDFSQVRIHNDSSAVEMNRSIHSQAFTNGNNIYFNKGKYNPDSDSGKKLLAHELTHVVQQNGSKKINKKSSVPQIQTAFPRIRSPRIRNLSSINAATRTNLLALIQAYISSPSEATGEAAVSAVTSALESMGTVRYSGQDDISNDSPNFRTRPSMDADTQGATSTLAGFAYIHSITGKNKVEIYHNAFIGDSNEERLGFLAGVIVHEYIHILQKRVGGTQSEDERELQAWLWQGENARQLGIQAHSAAGRQILIKIDEHLANLSAARRRQLARRIQRVRTYLNPPIQETESVQQKLIENKSTGPELVQRKLTVEDDYPQDYINFAIKNQKGKDQSKSLSNVERLSFVSILLNKLSPHFKTESGGEVKPVRNKTETELSKDSKATASCCMHILTRKSSTNDWNIFVADHLSPHTFEPKHAILINSELSPVKFSAHTSSGKKHMYDKAQVILGHEMCGHAALMELESHPEGKRAVTNVHDPTVNIENEIAKEQGEKKENLRGLANSSEKRGESFGSMVIDRFKLNMGSITGLPSSEQNKMRMLADMIRIHDMFVEIRGHSDNQGSEFAKQEVSDRRAAQARKFLLEMGVKRKSNVSVAEDTDVPINRFVLKGLSDKEPPENVDPLQQDKFRRVEVIVASFPWALSEMPPGVSESQLKKMELKSKTDDTFTKPGKADELKKGGTPCEKLLIEKAYK